MKRKNIIILIVSIIMLICIGFSTIFILKNKPEEQQIKNDSNNSEQLNTDNEEKQIDIKEEFVEDIKIEKEESKESVTTNKESNNKTNEIKKDESVVKKEDTNKSETNKKNNEQKQENNKPAEKEENKTPSAEPEQSIPEKEESKKEDSDPEIEDEKQETLPTVDEEYEKLKKLYKYPTSQSCFEASIEASIKVKETESNYRNAGCVSGSYKGELVGYRIIICYTDGTTKFYDN